ncbi:hypothetical protein IMZ29_11590 [Achromobacter sp. GG226]|uniref:hypothetical protein n=1 Tax=Verticiella alkaliphila TaxID=2779529 RepID=UPI001C0E2DB6|nr:hypothetical protein [Verticiella sp. GG226]MBU4611151.1 hypothetical protein [Verticiella sp. GG226]
MTSLPRPLLGLIAIYLVLSALTLGVWEQRQTYRVNGDEPWYLLIASGITRFGTLEQSLPHDTEVAERRMARAIPAYDAANPGFTHMVAGPNGRYSVHNLGLPVLIAPGFALAGVLGARLTLILVGVWVLVSVWRVAGLAAPSTVMRTWATAGTALALPLLGGAGQIYPDIVAGAICLHLLATLLCRAPATAASWTSGLLLAALPWLQIRYAAPTLVLAIALLWGLRAVSRQARWAAAGRLLLPGVVAAALLGAYHLWAFGQLAGPYSDGALRPGLTALLVLLGLHVDQNQGLLVQNPMLWLGVAGMGALIVRHPRVGIATLGVYLVTLVPNALHPNWYGGWSFSGRFGWTAALVLAVPAVIAFGRIATARPRWALGIALAALAWQGAAYVGYTFTLGADAWYNRAVGYLPTPGLAAYGLFGGKLWPWLPTVYGGADDTTWHWALWHRPNIACMVVLAGMLGVGFWRARAPDARFTRAVLTVAIAGVVLIVLAGTRGPRPVPLPTGHEQGQRWMPCTDEHTAQPVCVGRLRGTTGQPEDGMRIARAGRDAPGLLVFGALQWLERGSYRLKITYASPADEGVEAGLAEFTPIESGAPAARLALPGTAGATRTAAVAFHVRDAMRTYETVVSWRGTDDLVLRAIQVQPTP